MKNPTERSGFCSAGIALPTARGTTGGGPLPCARRVPDLGLSRSERAAACRSLQSASDRWAMAARATSPPWLWPMTTSAAVGRCRVALPVVVAEAHGLPPPPAGPRQCLPCERSQCCRRCIRGDARGAQAHLSEVSHSRLRQIREGARRWAAVAWPCTRLHCPSGPVPIRRRHIGSPGRRCLPRAITPSL